MALVLQDRVRETSTTSGTGTIVLAGAVSGFQSFSAIGNTNTTYYCIADSSTGGWEVGIGTYTSSGTTLSRDTVLASSNSGALVAFSANVKDVFCTYPSSKSANVNAALTSGRVTYATTNGLLTDSANLTFDGTTLSAAGLSDSGNLTFTGTGNRITGDFSNATPANRLAFQTSTANSSTIVSILPSGTGTAAALDVFNNSDPTNSAKAQLVATATSVDIRSAINSSGTYVPMLFFTGGSERVRIDTSGNVGVGTTATLGNASLNVNQGVVARTAAASGIIPYLQLYNGNAGTDLKTWRIGGGSGGSLSIETVNDAYSVSTQKMAIDSAGNVGIGTSTPATKFAVSNSGAAGLEFFVNYPGGGVGTYIQSYNRSGAAYVNTAYNALSHSFQISAVEKVVIDSSGNVGIGTSSPAAKLQVTSSTAGDGIRINGNNFAGINYYGSSVNTTGVFTGLDSGGGFVTNVRDAGYLAWSTTNTERMRIDSSGNVGIGTSSPTTRLSVVSGTNAGISVNDGTVNTIIYNSTGGVASVGTTTNHPVDFYANNAARMRITAAGDVGIGTSSPNGNLAVQQASATTGGPVLSLWNSNASGGNTCGYLKFYSNVSVRAQIHSVIDAGSPFYGNLIFSTGESTMNERARIDSSGNLLVGTTSANGIVTAARNMGNGYSATFAARALGTAQGQLAGYSFLPTFVGTGDNVPRRAADIWGGFTANWGAEYLAFGVGIGTGNDAGNQTTERMRIDGSGSLLVGSTSVIVNYTQVSVTGSSTNRGALIMGRTTAATSGVAGTLAAYNGSNAICGMDFQSNGANNSGYIGTYTYSAGSFVQGPYLNTGGTSWTTASDQNLKDVSGEITNALDKVSQIRAVEFTWKADESKKQHVGFIAQEVQAVLPEVIDTDTNGYLGVRYAEVTSLLLAAIQEQQALIESLTTRLTALESKA